MDATPRGLQRWDHSCDDSTEGGEAQCQEYGPQTEAHIHPVGKIPRCARECLQLVRTPIRDEEPQPCGEQREDKSLDEEL